MDFKQLLKLHRSLDSTYAEAIGHGALWSSIMRAPGHEKPPGERASAIVEEVEVKEAPQKVEQISQKEILDSLKKLAQDEVQIENTDLQIVNDGQPEGTFLELKAMSLDNDPKDFLFVSHRFQGQAESWESSQGGKTLLKMIQAMQVKSFEVFPDFELSKLDDLKKMLWRCQPKFVITLGGKASQLFTQGRRRLQETHGRFYECTIAMGEEKRKYWTIPVFHPDYLTINPEMKKIAWEDLQKVMERDKKS